MGFWESKKVLVTGGHGFVGTHLLRKLKKRGCSNIITSAIEECDLRKESNIIKLYKASKPDMVIHLAAVVGGIEANRKNPGAYFYDNLIMGVQLIEQARVFNINKFVAVGTICAYPKFTPVPFKEENLWNGYPEETNAPYGLAKKMLLVQAQAYRKQYGLNCIYLLPVNMYGPCFSGDTDIITKNGIKNIKKVEIGDMVYTLNTKTFEIEESKVTAKQRIPTKEMFVFKGRSVDFKVTPDHKIFYKTSAGFVKRRADFFRNRAGRKYGQLTLAFHKIKKRGNKPDFVDLSKYIDRKHIKIGNEYVRDFGSSRGNSSKPFPLVYKAKYFSKFIGWYVSEGSLSKIGRNSKQIRITQWGNNPRYRSEIEDMLKSMKIPFGKDVLGFYFTSRIWARFIEEHLGEKGEDKRLPKFVFNWQPKLLKLTLDAMMKGDGDKSGKRYSTKSPQLMLDFLHLAFLCGVKAGAVYREKGCWRISIRKHKKNTTVKYKDIQIKKTRETAYCITTSKNHVVYAGRNHKFNWIGQCDDFNPETCHVIPATIKRCVDAKEKGQEAITVWGTGKASREFLYVEDGAEGILLAAEKYNKPDPVNVGVGFEITIKDLITLIARLTGFKGKIAWDTSKPDGQPRRSLDTSKAKKEFGFEARVSFEEGLKKTIDWYLEKRKRA